ncbi:hypothetical protein AB0D08_32895 [Kitasatospora sp. NPDC048540]|uniref:hypothetical protein n=1 Tax=unclassified Kitasatospora TaxID=2633591 RepID=UPI0005398CA1|nr:hypothetical protein [Kitasatospora sp. MBT63]
MSDPTTGEQPETVIVFPNAAQLENVSRTAADTGTPLTVIVPDGAPRPAAAGVTVLSATEAAGRTAPHGARVMCCHESGVYWVAEHRAAVGSPNFAEVCLDMLVKTRLAAELGALGVTVVDKRRLDEVEDRDALSYPLIAKPDFGFASMLVKRIPDARALEEYERSYRELRERSLLTEYDDFIAAYPDADPWNVILEPDLTRGTLFLTVPFLVRDGDLAGMFPVQGVGRRGDELTDFHWSAFHCGDVPENAANALRRDLELIIEGLELTGGVYEIEALYDERHDTLHVLEFSPRVTGGFIPELVRRTTGVDVELLGLQHFLGIEPTTATAPGPITPHLLALLHEDDPEPAQARGAAPVASRSRHLGGVEFRDVIYPCPAPNPAAGPGNPAPGQAAA